MRSVTTSRRAFVASSLCLSLAGIAALAGCGSSTEESSTEQADDTAATDAETAEDAAETETTESETSETEDDGLGLVVEGKLTIGSDCDYPPFIYMDGEEPRGFEYDLLTAICEKMGLELNFLAPQKFDTLIAAVAVGGKMDLAVSSINITDERKETVDFCDPYFDSNLSLSVLKSSSYKSSADLEGKQVGVQSGTTGEAWAKENIADATIVPFDDQSSAFVALQAGKVDAVCIDLPVAADMIKTSYSDCTLIEEIATGEQYGFAVSKDNNALRDAVNDALQAVNEDGTYATLYDQYFSVEE